MKPLVAAVIATVVILTVGTAFVFYPQVTTDSSVTSTSGTSTSITSSVSSTTFPSATSSSTSTKSSNGLELRLSLNTTSLHPGNNLGVTVSEFNTKSTQNNVTKADQWGVQGLSLGTCQSEGYGTFPFGMAVYQGRYSAANASAGTPIQVFPVVPCPLMLRLVTGYLFQPNSDQAVILPSSGSIIPLIPMRQNLTISGDYSGGVLKALSPGVYTVVAGDQWGALETVQFTVSGQSQSSSTSTSIGAMGTLNVSIGIGPTAPVCMANATTGPAPPQYSSIEAVVKPSSGANMTFPVNWTSNGCEVLGVFHAPLDAGAYTLNLSSCTWMGCKNSLPKAFTIYASQTTDVSVSIDTGIR